MGTKYVYRWEGDTTQPHDDGFTWKSKKMLLPVRTAFGAARVIASVGDRADYYALVVARQEAIRRNQARISALSIGGAIGEDTLGSIDIAVNGDLLEAVTDVEAYSGVFELTLNWYVDGVLRFTKDVYASDVPFRLAAKDAGKTMRGRSFEMEITGNVEVKRIDVAGTVDELKALQQGGE